MPVPVSTWSSAEVAHWMEQKGFHMDSICSKHKLDGAALLSMREQDFQQLILEELSEITVAIKGLRKCESNGVSTSLQPAHGGFSRLDSNSNVSVDIPERGSGGTGGAVHHHRNRHDSGAAGCTGCSPRERVKFVVGALFLIVTFYISALIVVFCNDNMPPSAKYPPLPDVILDNVTRVPWGYAMSEWCINALILITAVILVFHKHRFLILRRGFVIFSTLHMLRWATMLVTSLSAPGEHMTAALCNPQPNSSFWSKAERAVFIWAKFGMFKNGVRTCGDLVYSGHTVSLTVLNYFITTYSTFTTFWLHAVSWGLNIAGMLSVLVAHEHYTIDVLVAFYTSAYVFHMYHILANNPSILKQGRISRVWVPLYSLFQSPTALVDSGVVGAGRVPNEYEWPFPAFSLRNCLDRFHKRSW